MFRTNNLKVLIAGDGIGGLAAPRRDADEPYGRAG